MAQKDFSAVGANIEKSLSKRKQQTTATPEEQAQRRSEGRTQGRKGCKAMRYNVAFSDDNAAYIRLMARATGKSQTQVINDAVAAERERHADLMQQAEELLKAFEEA